MTWGRIAHPSEFVKIGDTITVKFFHLIKIMKKSLLVLNNLLAILGKKFSAELKVGSRIKGNISSITDYGLFVEIAKGVEGLVHISEVSWTDRINDLA